MAGVLFFVRGVFLAGLVGLSGLSIAAFLGFASPLLDALNHFQPIWFAGTLFSLLLVPFVFRKSASLRAVLALAATGFLASAVIVVPEIVSSWLTRPAIHLDRPVVKLMSRNLFGQNDKMAQVASDIAAEDPDIIAFQEYFTEQRNELHRLIAQKYPFFVRCSGGRRAFLAIYSKTAFELSSDTLCPDSFSERRDNIARLVARFKDQSGQEFTIVNTQLNWPIQINPLFRSGLSITERLAGTYERKSGEWSELAKAINAIKGPLVLVGDFNSTPWSYALARFEALTGLKRQTRNLATYPKLLYWSGRWRETFPVLPIDHIFSRGDIGVYDVVAGKPAGSDHLPLIARFSVGAGG
ncbi:hypothetical protein MNBD_ALPHA12-528 [hydrothermal vent metagenome]|uniref:Endonuclease/exonuclease/phosphatase domain-containing protein n=3 Tax=hydrothermal vent metagenome TaxID=652676 RepID=A0A3B0TZN1_9ZZZZ